MILSVFLKSVWFTGRGYTKHNWDQDEQWAKKLANTCTAIWMVGRQQKNRVFKV